MNKWDEQADGNAREKCYFNNRRDERIFNEDSSPEEKIRLIGEQIAFVDGLHEAVNILYRMSESNTVNGELN